MNFISKIRWHVKVRENSYFEEFIKFVFSNYGACHMHGAISLITPTIPKEQNASQTPVETTSFVQRVAPELRSGRQSQLTSVFCPSA